MELAYKHTPKRPDLGGEWRYWNLLQMDTRRNGEKEMNSGQRVNPYIAGPALNDDKGFFGRQDILDQVAKELENEGVQPTCFIWTTSNW